MTRDVIAALTAFPKFGDGTGEARMAALTRDLPATPWFQTGRAIHVVGSHGKGTVATLTAAILRAYGLRTGLYLSPHLFRFEERMVIDGTPIGADALTAAYKSLRAPTGAGAFEMITATALAAFARARLDTVILEAGIGGRHDSTKIASGKIVALTGIDREHLDVLGPAERDVLFQKADLCPPGGTLIAGALKENLSRALSKRARARQFMVQSARHAATIHALVPSEDGMRADLQVLGQSWTGVTTRLFGPRQADNAVLAILLARAWLGEFGSFEPFGFERAARAALAATPIPLRFQRLSSSPAVYADVAHTPDSLRALADTARLHLGAIEPVVVLGVSEGKDPVALTREIVPFAARILCSAAQHRGLDPRQLADAIPPGDVPVEVCPDLREALSRACARAKAEQRAVLVTGSLFMARDAALALTPGLARADASL